jgi:hypothetical protein
MGQLGSIHYQIFWSCSDRYGVCRSGWRSGRSIARPPLLHRISALTFLVWRQSLAEVCTGLLTFASADQDQLQVTARGCFRVTEALCLP